MVNSLIYLLHEVKIHMLLKTFRDYVFLSQSIVMQRKNLYTFFYIRTNQKFLSLGKKKSSISLFTPVTVFLTNFFPILVDMHLRSYNLLHGS